MMKFREVTESVIKLLGSKSNNLFKVIGYQTQSTGSEETLDLDRTVEVYYSHGKFPKEKGGFKSGPFQHDGVIRLDLSVSKAAEGDLSVLGNENSHPSEIIVALDSIKSAAYLADKSLDELFDIVFQILMDPRNVDMGLEIGDVANRWIPEIQKDQPSPEGSIVVLTGSTFLEFRVSETVEGEKAIVGGSVIDTVVDLYVDDTEKAGVVVNG